MQRFDYMICKPTQMSLIPFAYDYCETPSLYLPISYTLPFKIFGIEAIRVSTFQLHLVMLVSFASFIAPFSGFLASGFKRVLNIKDFANTLPGHGGLTDRFDCHTYMVSLLIPYRELLFICGLCRLYSLRLCL